MSKFFNRHFGKIIYLLYFLCELIVLRQGLGQGLFPAPVEGMDQHGMLWGAGVLLEGALPGAAYHYSYFYTVFLAFLLLVTGKNLILMRIVQAAIAALIPVLIYRSARLMKLGRLTAQLAAFLYFFYAPALLISLDFLRASMLALVFMAVLYFILVGWRRRSNKWFIVAGIFAALCILGRETFIIVVPVPLLFYLWAKVRNSLGWRPFAYYALACGVPVLAVMTFNYIAYNSFQVLPDNINIAVGFFHGGEAVSNTGFAAASLIKNIPAQVYHFLCLYEIPNSLSVYAHKELIPALRVFAVPFNLLAALAFVGVWHYRRNGLVILVFLLVGAFAGSLCFFEIYYRYRIPALPLVSILAGAGIMALCRYYRRKEYRALTVSLVIAGALFAATWVKPDSRRTFDERASVSKLLIENRRYAEAERYLMKMLDDGCEDARYGAVLLVRQLFEDGEDAWAREVISRFNLPAE